MEGYVGLFLSALLAATVLPFSSEAVLVGLMAAGDYDMIWLWFLASLGNVLGAAVNWGLGRFCLRWQDRRWFPVDKEKLDRAGRWFSRYGVWSLLFDRVVWLRGFVVVVSFRPVSASSLRLLLGV